MQFQPVAQKLLIDGVRGDAVQLMRSIGEGLPNTIALALTGADNKIEETIRGVDGDLRDLLALFLSHVAMHGVTKDDFIKEALPMPPHWKTLVEQHNLIEILFEATDTAKAILKQYADVHTALVAALANQDTH